MRALVEWINDNQLTPHILVDAGVAGVQVPPSSIKDGRVVLNIAERAVVGLVIDNESVSFSARFSGFPLKVGRLSRLVTAKEMADTREGTRRGFPDDVQDSMMRLLEQHDRDFPRRAPPPP